MCSLLTDCPAPLAESRSYWSIVLHRFLQDRLALLALVFLCALAVSALFAPSISSALGVNPYQTDPENVLAPPELIRHMKSGWNPRSKQNTWLTSTSVVPHWLGTDQLGRDHLARLLFGGRVSLFIALAAGTLQLVLGVGIGVVAGYCSGSVDDVVAWSINTVASVPMIYLLITAAAIFGPSVLTLIVLLGSLGWVATARLIRGSVLRIREQGYIEAARALGASDSRIIFRHVIPNCVNIILVNTSMSVGSLILTESALSFLGLGVQPPIASWGNMLNRGLGLLFLRDPATGAPTALHLILAPGLLITLTVLALYLISDGLRDALDPTLRSVT